MEENTKAQVSEADKVQIVKGLEMVERLISVHKHMGKVRLSPNYDEERVEMWKVVKRVLQESIGIKDEEEVKVAPGAIDAALEEFIANELSS